MMDRGTAEFYSKNKFEKLEHLIGFIIRNFRYFLGLICRYYLGALAAIIAGTRKKVINAGKEKEIQIER